MRALKLKKDFFIKSTIFLILLRSPIIILTMTFYLFTSKRALFVFLSKVLPIATLLLAMAWYSLYLGNTQQYVLGQARDIFLALFVSAVLISHAKELGTNKVCYETVKLCFILVAICKVLILFYSVATGIGLNVIIKKITQVWGIQMMTLTTENSALGRIQIPIDSVVPYFLYFYTKEIFQIKKGKIGKVLFLLLCFSMLLTYSRIMWAQTVLFIFMSVAVEFNFSKKIKFTIVLIFLFSFLYFLTPLGGVLDSVLASRIGNSNINNASDIERQLQDNAIWLQISESPVFGHGIGYYIPNLIRSSDAKYLYESQTLSIIMDVGFVGAIALLSLIVFFYILTENKISNILGPAFFLLFWVFCGSYNPYLFGASGGLILYFCSQFNNVNEYLIKK